jgi:hypothetical protein
LPNDGTGWFGPDTTLGATAPGQYGGTYTLTSGIQESVDYIASQGGGKVILKMGRYVITGAPPTYAVQSGGNSRIINLPTVPNTSPLPISIIGESHAIGQNDLYIDATGLSAFGNTNSCYVFSPTNFSQGLSLEMRNFGMRVPQNVGGVSNVGGYGGQYVNIDVQASTFPSNTNTVGFYLDGYQNGSWINMLYASGMYYAYTTSHSFFNAGIIYAGNCYAALLLEFNGNTNAVGGHIKFLGAGPCTYGITTSGSGSSGAHIDIDYYSMYIQSTGLNPSYVADIWDQEGTTTPSSIHIGTASVINSTGSPYVWQLPAIKSGTIAPGLQIDAIDSATGMIANRIVGGILTPQGFGVTTPAVPASGTNQVNGNPFPVRIYITSAGTTTAYTITDPAGNAETFSFALTEGQDITLDPNASINITYTAAPTWKWYGAYGR